MTPRIDKFSAILGGGILLLALLVCALPGAKLRAEPPCGLVAEEKMPSVLNCPQSVWWALRHNPTLEVARAQRGIASAGVVIAKTYPFNPMWQNFTWGASGPPSAGVTNPVFTEQTVRLDVEMRGQGRIRREMAQATLSRTDWEIAVQELTLGIRTIRAFNTALYRQEKLRLIDDTVRFNEQSLAQIQRLLEQNKLRPADLMLAKADMIDVRSQRGPARIALVMAWQELYRSLGSVNEEYSIRGVLGAPLALPSGDNLMEMALASRPEMHARLLTVKEADARLRLEIANRYANPSIGPAFERNETSVNFYGIWTFIQLPVFNIRQGEILQRRAEVMRAQRDVAAVEVQVQQDVKAAQARLHDAQAWGDNYRNEVLPTLQQTQEGFDKLLAAGDPGVDVLRLIDIRRRLLRARDVYLDALWELSQAQADMAAAVGDPFLACAGLTIEHSNAAADGPALPNQPPVRPAQLPEPKP